MHHPLITILESIVSPLIFQSHEGTSLDHLDKAPILVVSASNPYEVDNIQDFCASGA